MDAQRPPRLTPSPYAGMQDKAPNLTRPQLARITSYYAACLWLAGELPGLALSARRVVSSRCEHDCELDQYLSSF